MSFKSMHKAAQVFSRECYEAESLRAFENHQDPRKYIMGANYYHHSDDPEDVLRQYMINGYMGISYTEHLPDLLEADTSDGNGSFSDSTVQQLFISGQSKFDVEWRMRKGSLPYLTGLKAIFLEEKRKHKGERRDSWNRDYRLIDDMEAKTSIVVNIEYLIRLMEVTDCKGGETFYYTNSISPIYVEKWEDSFKEYPAGIGIEGVLLPIRHSPDKICLND